MANWGKDGKVVCFQDLWVQVSGLGSDQGWFEVSSPHLGHWVRECWSHGSKLKVWIGPTGFNNLG